MSDPRRIHRRSLFDAFRRALDVEVDGQAEASPQAPKPAPFSLTSFYARRAAAGVDGAELPHFVLREGLEAVETVPPFAEPVGPTRKGRP